MILLHPSWNFSSTSHGDRMTSSPARIVCGNSFPMDDTVGPRTIASTRFSGISHTHKREREREREITDTSSTDVLDHLLSPQYRLKCTRSTETRT